MNWNEYEKMLLKQIADAKYNLEHIEKEYFQAKSKHSSLLLQHESFKLALKHMLGDE